MADTTAPRLMGAAEIGLMLGISRQRVQQLAASNGFPKPVAALSMGKVWATDDVTAWARATGRGEAVDAWLTAQA